MRRMEILTAVLCVALAAAAAQAQVQSPEEFFGFKPGADYKLARWDKIVEYFWLLDKASDRIEVFELGKSTEGNPFVLAIISSPENLAAKDEYREINRKLADPRGLSEAEIKELLARGKYTLAVTNSLHATEVGGTQMAPQLAWELVTGEDEQTKLVLDNCFLLLFPSFNPDGQIMVVDWYNRWLGTEYEGSRLPYLYHKYTGHDNNRDGYALTQAEARLMSKVLYQEWWPQAYIDHHHMGSYGARFYIPPYFDPVHPGLDPLVWREHLLYGAQMAMRLEEADKSGIETGAPYTAWWMPSFHMITNYHNIAGMLTESASAEVASPKYIHAHQLRGGQRGRPGYEEQVNFPNPWPGGWWRLGDVVEQQKISTHAALEVGARNREMMLHTAYLKAKRNIDKGSSEAPYAYIVPMDQHDPLTALKMLDKLMFAGVEVHRAEADFWIGNEHYAAGTYVIQLAQPLRTYVKCLLERVFYPENEWTSNRDGSPLRPYDMSAFTMAEHMGVAAIESAVPVEVKLAKVDKLAWPEGGLVGDGENGWLLCHRPNDSITAMDRALEAGAEVYWLAEPKGELPVGVMLIKAGKDVLEPIARDLHLTFHSAPAGLEGKALKIGKPRLAMFQRYNGGNMDEGWTRFLLEQFEIDYTSIMCDEIKQGGLNAKYDVIVLPQDRLSAYTGVETGRGDGYWPRDDRVPPEYAGVLGEEGIQELKKFVEEGGILITLDSSADLPIAKFGVEVSNVLENVPQTEHFCPGSTLWMEFDTSHPVAFGMPEYALGINWFSQALAVRPVYAAEKYQVVARYPNFDPLQSGWLIGPQYLQGKASVIDAALGKGRVIMIGFRAQLRAQSHGTFKLLFNAIYYGASEPTELK